MFYLLIQIHNIRQLQKIKQPYMTSVERSLLHLLESRGARHLPADGGDALFLFAGSQATESTNLVDAVHSAYRYLVSRRDDLMGFLLLLDVAAGEDDESVLRRMRAQLRGVDLDEALLLGENAASGLESLLRMHSSNGHWIVDERIERAPTKLGEAAEFCRHPQIYQQVMDTIGTYWDDDWEPGVLLLHGPRMSGKRQNLSYALERLGGDEDRSGFVELTPGVRRHSVITPLVNSLRGWELGEVPVHLSARERFSWAERVGLLESLLGQRGAVLCPDSLQRDFLLAYGLFVQSFVRRMEALLIPAVLVCYDVQSYETDTIEILGSLFERFLPSQMFLPVLVSQKPYLPPELRDFPYRKLRIPAVDDVVIDELSHRFLNDSPGGPKPPEWIRQRTGGNIVSMFYLFHVQTRPDLKEADVTNVAPELRTVWSAICGLGAAEQTVLYAVMLCWELLPPLRTIEILSELDIPQARIPEITKLLADLNLVNRDTLLTPSVPDLEKPLALLLGSSATEARRTIVSRALYLRRMRLIPVSEVLFELSRGFVDPQEERLLFGELVSDLLDQRELAAAFRLLYGDCPYPIDAPSSTSDPTECAMVLGLRLRLALLANDRRGSETAFHKTGNVEMEAAPGARQADLLLQRARYLFSRGEYGPALNLIKQAIILYQEAADARGLAAAHSDFGLLMLAQEQLIDAREYFVIAGKNVEPDVSVYEYVRSRSLETASHFVYGSYTRVVERIEQLSELVVQAGMREWGLYLMMIRGRVLFELGRYDEAQLHFQRSLTEAQLCQHIPAHRIFYAWLARSAAYSGFTARAIEMLAGMRVTRETEFFTAEAHIFDENFSMALAALERAAGISPENEQFAAESLAWQSGFSDLEDLTVGRNGSGLVSSHLLKAFHGYTLARVGRLIDGIAEMHRLTREDGVSKLDPYNHLYYLLYALILPDARDAGRDPAFEDRLTVLGKAVKNMQQRLTRIDRYDDKISYQRHSRWNGILFSEAIAHNLL